MTSENLKVDKLFIEAFSAIAGRLARAAGVLTRLLLIRPGTIVARTPPGSTPEVDLAPTMLRRVRTTIYASKIPPGPQGNVGESSQVHISAAHKAARRVSQPVDLSKAVESPHSVHLRQQYQEQHLHDTLPNSISKFGRRLARKASIFSLRGKSKAHNQSREVAAGKTKGKAIAHLEKELPEPPSSSVCSSPIVQDRSRNQGWNTSSRSTVILSRDIATDSITNLDAFPCPPQNKGDSEAQQSRKAPTDIRASPPDIGLTSLPNAIRLKQRLLEQEGYINQSSHNQDVIVRMAAENAAPPISYARLQELTVSV